MFNINYYKFIRTHVASCKWSPKIKHEPNHPIIPKWDEKKLFLATESVYNEMIKTLTNNERLFSDSWK